MQPQSITALCACGCGERVTRPESRFLRGHNWKLFAPAPRSCRQCQQTFSPKPRDIRRGAGVFCSRTCWYAWCNEPEQAAARFWTKFADTPQTGCWLYTGPTFTNGYGRFLATRHYWPAHRYAYVLAAGPIPDHLVVGHVCDVPLCARNDEPGAYYVNGIALPRFGHLFLCTRKQNQEDMAQKQRGACGERNGSRLYPERRTRGDAHWTRQHPQNIPRGEHRASAKLTEAQVRWAIAQMADGVQQQDIARQLGVSKGLINQVARGRIWRHVR